MFYLFIEPYAINVLLPHFYSKLTDSETDLVPKNGCELMQYKGKLFENTLFPQIHIAAARQFYSDLQLNKETINSFRTNIQLSAFRTYSFVSF